MAEESIVQLELTLTLPTSLAREAEAQGLLTSPMLKPCCGQKYGAARWHICLKRLISLLPLPRVPLTEAEMEAKSMPRVRKGVPPRARGC